MKHTEAPWTFCLDDDSTKISVYFFNEKMVSITETPETNYSSDDLNVVRVNAHLIVASPYLLEACNDVLKRFGGSIREYEEMTPGQKLAMERTVEAIRKAEGGK